MSIAPPTSTDEAAQPVAPAPTPSRWAPLRPLVLRLHFYAGVFVAPFLLIAAVTGFLYAGAFQAEKIAYRHEMTVAVGDAELPISDQVDAARKAHPEGTVSAIRPSPAADATTRVMLSGVKGVEPNHTLAVFVDPYTGKVRGALEQYGSTGALPLRTWIDEFHRDLHFGVNGRLDSEFAAGRLWVIAGDAAPSDCTAASASGPRPASSSCWRPCSAAGDKASAGPCVLVSNSRGRGPRRPTVPA